MSENLKKCPFCGEKAVIQKIALGGGDFGFRVACSGNRCRAATYVRETRKEAKTEWNNRPIEDEQASEIKRLREALEHVVTTDTTVDKWGIWRIDGKTFQTWASDVLKEKKND